MYGRAGREAAEKAKGEPMILPEHQKQVAAYCRVSTDHSDQANSLESQMRFFRQYIDGKPDWNLYRVFADEGITGTSTKKRHAFHQMIEDAMQGKFQLILTKEISRFARNTLDSIYYTRELKKYGVAVCFLNDNINTMDPDAELRLTIMSSIAQEESRRTSERVKWGQKRRMEQGIVFGRDMLGYDVRNGKMFVNEKGAEIVRFIFSQLIHEGKGAHSIARELEAREIETPTGKRKWSDSVILRILRNEKYCGDLIQKKTITPDYLSHAKKYNHGEEAFVILRDHHEPIIDRTTFEQAKEILEGRSARQKNHNKYSSRHCFSGKIKCGRCGANYVARFKLRKDHSRYGSWCCSEAKANGRPDQNNSKGCFAMSIRDDDAFHLMALTLQHLAIDTKRCVTALFTVVSAILEQKSKISESQRERNIKKKERLLELYLNEEITEDEFRTARRKFEKNLPTCGNASEAFATQERLKQLRSTAEAIAFGGLCDETFYREILDHMVVTDREHISLFLKNLPLEMHYAILNE